MAYSKSRYVEAAQKLLNQGKVPQAIAEYQQILKYEPKDQVTLMTIGELYIRQGETFQAIDYFERLAQLFVGDGFLTKAIAVYKRIAKLAPEEIRPLEKLADLYVQQGVMSEARPLFLQLAEIHLKSNRRPEAVSLLKKLLLAEPDNLRIQIRLADLYHAMGQNADAIDAYVSAAQRALARGDQGECEKLVERALKIDPKNQAAVIVKARIFSSQGKADEAAKELEQVADLHKGGEQTELLLDIYIKNSDWEQASALASRVFDADIKNFGPAQKVVDALLQADDGEQAFALLNRIRIPMVDAGEGETAGRLLSELSARLPGRLEPLEWLVELHSNSKDSSNLPDALAQLGNALVAAKKYERAKEVFEQLVAREPESAAAKRKLNDVLRKLGNDEEEETPTPAAEEIEEPLLPVELKRPAAPKLAAELDAEAHEVKAKPAADAPGSELDDETQKFIAQSLTDVDLFASYGLTQKAIGLLEAILRRAPHHAPTLEKLLDFVLGAGDDRRTAELAAQLEQLHTQSGDVRSAERFGELRRRFQRAAGISDEDLMPTQAATPEPVETPAAAPPAAEPEEIAIPEAEAPAAEAVHEVDLSDEWASMLKESQPVELGAGAHKAPAEAAPEFEIPVETTTGPENTNPFAEISAEIPVDQDLPPITIRREAHERASIFEKEAAPEAPAAPPVQPEKPAAKSQKPKPRPPEPKPKAPEPEPEFEVEQDYELVLDAEPLEPAHDHKPPAPPPARRKTEPVHHEAAPAGFASDQFLADLANEIDQLGLGEVPSAPPAPAAHKEKQAAGKNSKKPAAAAPPSPSAIESGPLKEVFDEFRAELGEMGAEDEDLETHYNLGTAFREMGLLEEAISEFQKVAKATERGRPFRYMMQCCTLLGLAFMEKGQPGVAAIWYERALHTPDLDPESTLALRYDLGVAQESAGEPSAALKSFSQVYAMNIDYRDVGERIAALQKPAR
jgi:tetratricopeptide (TPR) repeat protein